MLGYDSVKENHKEKLCTDSKEKALHPLGYKAFHMAAGEGFELSRRVKML